MKKIFTPFLKPNEVLSESEVNYLRNKNDIKGILLLIHAWFIISSSILIYSLFPNVFTFVAAVLVIAGRQLGLAILMHEGAHGLITNNIKLNKELHPNELLVNQVNKEIQLEISNKSGSKKRKVTVKPNGFQTHLYYRDWVEKTTGIKWDDYGCGDWSTDIEMIDQWIVDTDQPYDTLWSEKDDGIYLVSKKWSKEL